MDKSPIYITSDYSDRIEDIVGKVEFTDTARAKLYYEMLKERPDLFRFEIQTCIDTEGKVSLLGLSMVPYRGEKDRNSEGTATKA